ncbi:MAG TPA: glycosyltransferase [Candidatus Binataceae bacterium]|nr:glycosyltransferase [Candidatus Binataceae bacterium]
MGSDPLRISAIVAARNATATLPRCLDALTRQGSDDVEVIVVDDFSTDDSRSVVARYPVRLIALADHAGVAAARNRGAEAARGEVLFFLDADVVLAPGGIDRVRDTMATHPEIGAMIGSYDAAPDDQSLVSRFKNLAHHHFHQRGRTEATTFWGACGAIRREAFFAAGGFDEKRFKLPSIEDVELGSRLVDRGVRIMLDPELQVKHLKKWTLASLVITDVTRRAIPWTLLWMERRQLHSDLNFSWDQRLAALVSAAMLLALMLSVINPSALLLLAGMMLAAALLNRDLFRLLYEQGGPRLAVAGFFLQQLYYLYSLVGLTVGVAIYFVQPSSTGTVPSHKTGEDIGG